MRKYEVMYIVRPDLEEEATKATVERYQTVVTDNGGEVEKLDDKGKRRLAYEINDYREGYYVLMNINANPAVVDELERLFNINEDIMRFIVVKEDE
ncbi:30S ribosomal protein S6 [Bacillus horti]|uniref:Small ribosomal subunit protein bS6 n=1 Tax=Caldalkalibacillus horti TaxID=77523 RepID=A0ABT9W1I8_9BACI|nr:30S ribosomal protein S6 [Bacillus horti]MDQ0167128.1 small subunit ribosomal protein S6 [Bacillus horti]